MTKGKVSEEQVVRALAGERVVIPLADGKAMLMFLDKGRLRLTQTGKRSTLLITDRPGEGAASGGSG